MKPDKDPFSPDSFRPINNLPTIEKLFEAYVMEYFIPFLEENDIIDSGGLKLTPQKLPWQQFKKHFQIM